MVLIFRWVINCYSCLNVEEVPYVYCLEWKGSRLMFQVILVKKQRPGQCHRRLLNQGSLTVDSVWASYLALQAYHITPFHCFRSFSIFPLTFLHVQFFLATSLIILSLCSIVCSPIYLFATSSSVASNCP